MNTSESVIEIFKALSECKKDFIPLQKNKQGYGYKYVTLDVVIDMLNNVLPKYGLGFVQFPSNDGENYSLTTRVFHTSGEWLEDKITFSLTEISKANDTQKLGASVTYFRRYTLSAIFGISTDEDVDGNIEQKQEKPIKKQFNEAQTNIEKPTNNFTLKNNQIFDGIYLTNDEDINNQIKSLISESCNGIAVFSEKTKEFLSKKVDENHFTSNDGYLVYLKRISENNKKKISESN